MPNTNESPTTWYIKIQRKIYDYGQKEFEVLTNDAKTHLVKKFAQEIWEEEKESKVNGGDHNANL